MRPVSTAPGVASYSEVLRVPLRWWALSTMFDASVLLAFLIALPLPVALGATAALVLLSTVFLLGYGRSRIWVQDGVFGAGRARIPVALLADPQELDADQTRRATGPDADVRAYLVLRPYLRRSVMVQVVDPADPVPYWLVSTRRPAALASTLRTAIRAAGADAGR